MNASELDFDLLPVRRSLFVGPIAVGAVLASVTWSIFWIWPAVIEWRQARQLLAEAVAAEWKSRPERSTRSAEAAPSVQGLLAAQHLLASPWAERLRELESCAGPESVVKRALVDAEGGVVRATMQLEGMEHMEAYVTCLNLGREETTARWTIAQIEARAGSIAVQLRADIRPARSGQTSPSARR